MWKSIDRLASVVEQKFALNPLSDMMLVFHNRHCGKIKILYWDENGFCLLYKRIEKGKFRFLKYITEKKYTVSEEKMSCLIQERILKHNEILLYEKSPWKRAFFIFLWHNNLRLRKWENFILMPENILSLYFILFRDNLRYTVFAA